MLGYVSEDASKDEAAVGFEAFYQDAQGILDRLGCDHAEWNTVVAEHTLCKFTRVMRNVYKV